MLTIFTPAYNKASKLRRLYESLLNQKNIESTFEWIVINDGSTDSTHEIMQQILEEEKLPIRYEVCTNRGKQAVYNKAVNMAKGDYFICIDADDYLIEDSLSIVEDEVEKIKDDEEIAGIGFLEYKDGTEEIVGSEYPEDYLISTYSDIYYKHKVTGDKQLTFKTKVLREFPFPVQEGEKFISEGIVFNRISKKYKMAFVNTPIAYVEYLEDGYSANYFDLVKRNPKGNMLYLKELYSVDKRLYNVAAYDLFGIYAKQRWIDTIKEHPNKFLAMIMYPVACFKYKQKEQDKE